MWSITIKDLIDILLVASMMYALYRKLRSNGSIALFKGLLAILFVWLFVTQIVQMRLLGAIMNAIMGVLLIAIVILFQNEIRQLLIRVGSQHRWGTLLGMFGRENLSLEQNQEWVDQVVLACSHMAEKREGALIVIQRDEDLDSYVKSGEEIDACITSRMIEQIFFKNSPLHDGAMIIKDGRIVAAACVLPLSHNTRIPVELGTRHRAGIGMSELSDARVVIVSEETGDISVAQRGRLSRHLTPGSLQRILLKN